MMNYERVIVRVLPEAMRSALIRVRSSKGEVAIATTAAIKCGTDFVIIINHFEFDRESRQSENPVQVVLREAMRNPASDHSRYGSCAATTFGNGLLELLLLDDGRLWATYWNPDGTMAPVTVVFEPFGRSISLPGDGGSHLDSRLLPRTSQLIGGDVAMSAWNNLHVALLGCGRSGSLIADAMCAQGLRRLTLVDDDLLEAGNLDGMTVVGTKDLGRPKADSLGRALCERFPQLAVSAVNDRFPTIRSVIAVAAADVLITAIDLDRPRLAANRFAQSMLQLHLDLGTGAGPRGTQAADVRLLTPYGRCLLCLGGVPDLRLNVSRRPGVSSRSINAIAVHLGCQLLMNALGEREPASTWLRVSQTRSPVAVASQMMTPLQSDVNCPWCSGIVAN
mgnify:CR=1 FL=1